MENKIGNPEPIEQTQSLGRAAEHWLTIDGSRMCYVQEGSGPALVLLHGLLGYSFSWRFVLPHFAQHATVYALDMLGSGFSDRPLNLDYTLNATAERLLRVLDILEINCCDLLGTSYGGAVAMMAASMVPQRIRRLVLAAPVNPWSKHGRRMAPLLSHRLIAPLFASLFTRAHFSHGRFLRRLFERQKNIPPDSLEGYSAPLKIPGLIKYALRTVSSWNADLTELESVLPKIEHIPTLLIWGDKDRAVAASSAIQLKKHFQSCELAIFENVGHLPYEEVPDKFSRTVEKFLWANELVHD